MHDSLFSTICLGLALAACCGFRVFIPLLAVCIASLTHFIHLAAGFSWIGSWTALICFSVASAGEIAAYYIPFVDNLLDTIATPLAIVAGALISTSVIPASDPMMRWGLGLIGGGGSAAIIQAGTGVLRLFSSKATLGAGNHVVSSGENITAIGGSIVSLLLPVIAAVILLLLILYLVPRIIRKIYS